MMKDEELRWNPWFATVKLMREWSNTIHKEYCSVYLLWNKKWQCSVCQTEILRYAEVLCGNRDNRRCMILKKSCYCWQIILKAQTLGWECTHGNLLWRDVCMRGYCLPTYIHTYILWDNFNIKIKCGSELLLSNFKSRCFGLSQISQIRYQY